MKTKYLAALSLIALTTGFSQLLTADQATQVALISIFNKSFVQHSLLSQNQLRDSVPPPVDGAPSDRKGAGTRVIQPHMKQPEAAPFSRASV